MQNNLPVILLIGLIAGIISSLFGVGGGIVFVPALTAFVGLDIKKAIGTSLSCIVPISFMGGFSHFINLNIAFPWMETGIIIISAVLSAQVGVVIAGRIKNSFLFYGFIIYIIVTVSKILLKNTSGMQAVEGNLPPYYILIPIGVMAGLISSLLGVGGGVVIVGTLVSFYNVNMILCIAMSLIVIIPTTISGLIGHSLKKNVQWNLTVPLVIPALVSAYLTASLAGKIPPRTLELLFCAFNIFVMINFWKKRNS